MISSCSDEDLIDIVLPRIAKVFTLWDFLLLKVQKGVPRRPHADDIYKEFKTLAKEVKEVCSTFMQPATEKSTNTLKVCSINSELKSLVNFWSIWLIYSGFISIFEFQFLGFRWVEPQNLMFIEMQYLITYRINRIIDYYSQILCILKLIFSKFTKIYTHKY